MKTLVVEDDFISRMILKKILSPYGQVDTVVNGKEAVQAFNLAIEDETPYDLICLDIMMPEMDGIEALKIIRQNEKARNISSKEETKIIMVTALDNPKEVIEAYYHGGCTTYLFKPIDKHKIINILKELKLIE